MSHSPTVIEEDVKTRLELIDIGKGFLDWYPNCAGIRANTG